MSDFIKILSVGVELFHANRRRTYTETDGQTERQTEMANLVVAFHKFTNAPKNLKLKMGPA